MDKPVVIRTRRSTLAKNMKLSRHWKTQHPENFFIVFCRVPPTRILKSFESIHSFRTCLERFGQMLKDLDNDMIGYLYSLFISSLLRTYHRIFIAAYKQTFKLGVNGFIQIGLWHFKLAIIAVLQRDFSLRAAVLYKSVNKQQCCRVLIL